MIGTAGGVMSTGKDAGKEGGKEGMAGTGTGTGVGKEGSRVVVSAGMGVTSFKSTLPPVSLAEA